jgi:hypothetical protein
MFGLLASANADAFATIDRANGKKKMNDRRIFELLQFICGGGPKRSFAFDRHIEVKLVLARFDFSMKL